MPGTDDNAGRAYTGIAESTFQDACVIGILGIYFNKM